MRKTSASTGQNSVIESLESRTFLSAVVGTATDFSVSAAKPLLGQAVTLKATVTRASGKGTPSGNVRFTYLSGRRQVKFVTVPLNSRGRATYTFTDTGSALAWGTYNFDANFVANASYGASTGVAKNVQVTVPTFTTMNNGLGYATIQAGTGATVASGDTITAMYTGFLASTAGVFDESSWHSSTGSQFSLSGVIAGWSDGIPGMKVGETRVLLIPPSLGYGSTAQGTAGQQGYIPANSTLVFVVQVLSDP